MARALETDVARHYGKTGLARTILDAIAAAGLDPQRLRPEDLAPIDEFHIGGRPATRHAVAKMALQRDMHVLDVGCGLGGASRYIASSVGCRVTGIDLTPEYIEVARLLADSTGLAERIEYRTASALDMPFAAASFDAAITLHVAMNIADRPGLYREFPPGFFDLIIIDECHRGSAKDESTWREILEYFVESPACGYGICRLAWSNNILDWITLHQVHPRS